MKKFSLLCLVAALMSTLCVSNASATFITSNGDLATTPAVSGGYTATVSNLGFGYVNTNSSGGVTSVTFANLNQATQIPPGGTVGDDDVGVNFKLPDGSFAGIVTVLRGTVSGSNANFTDGYAYIVKLGTTTSSISNRFTNGSLSTADIVAGYRLLSAQDVISGYSRGFGTGYLDPVRSGASVNLSSINVSTGEVATVAIVGEISGATNTSFLSNVEDRSPSPLKKGIEGLYSVTSQTILGGTGLGVQFTNGNVGPVSQASKLAVLNSFVGLQLGGVFANNIGVDFNPNGNGSTGDFVFSDNAGKAYIGHTIVPEPASVLVFAGMALVGGAARFSRKRKS